MLVAFVSDDGVLGEAPRKGLRVGGLVGEVARHGGGQRERLLYWAASDDRRAAEDDLL